MPYETWMDAKNLYVEKNTTHLIIKIEHYGNLSTTYLSTFGAGISIDIDRDGTNDYNIFARLRGSGSTSQRLSDSTGMISDADLKVWGPVGGDYIQIEVALSDIGNPQIMNMRVDNLNYLADHTESSFTYTVENDVAIEIDGDGSDWTGIPPVYSDPIEGINPSELDQTNFYTTNNGSMLYHRFDVVGVPTTQLSGTGSIFRRGGDNPNFLYDVDGDNTSGWSYLGMGLDYYVEIKSNATSSGKGTSCNLFKWQDDD